MKITKFIDIMKSGNFVISNYLFRIRDKFNVTLEEYIFLMYLLNKGEIFIFDPNKISEELNIVPLKVMEYVSSLSEKSLISVDVIKNEKNLREEYISLKLFYNKLGDILVDDMNKEPEKTKINIYEKIEKEFGRPLSPMEFEIIKAWLENQTTEELILEALKESVFNGVNNLRYIDKILFEWKKKGFKTKEDIEKYQSKYREEKAQKDKVEFFDFDWLEDEE